MLRTVDAASMSSGLWWSYIAVLVIYAGDDRRRVRRPAVDGPALAGRRSRPAEPVRAAAHGAGAVTLAMLVAMAMFLGVVIYALLGGADFGSGFFDLTAGNARERRADPHAGRPQYRAGVGGQPRVADLHPGHLVDRISVDVRRGDDHAVHPAGPSFGRNRVARRELSRFRKYSATLSQARLFGAIFAGSSLISPFFLGTVAGAIASGRVPADGYGDRTRFLAQSRPPWSAAAWP